MCGITGFVRSTPTLEPPAVLTRMTTALHHRGPDGAGFPASASPHSATGASASSISRPASCAAEDNSWPGFDNEIFHDNTLIVIAGDHGEAFGEKGLVETAIQRTRTCFTSG